MPPNDSSSESAPKETVAGPVKPPCDRDDAMQVLRRLRDGGHVAYFAGGCVRDLLLGLTPKDFDVATDAPPRRVRELFANTQAVGAAFGVILVRVGRSVVEVATFRAEGPYLDGRHPSEVRFTTAEEDAGRRDFTINGLFLDPIEDRVIDYVGGQQDLRAKVIRAIGDPEKRFEEDHLRMLRAVRFAARFGFVIESATVAAIVRHSPQLIRISPERIADELRTMLTPTTRSAAYRMLDELKLLPLIFRFYPPTKLPELGNRKTSVFDTLAPAQSIPLGLALAAAGLDHQLRHSFAGADVRPLLERTAAQQLVHALRQSLKISNEESDQLLGAIEGLAPLLRDRPPRVATLKRFLARPTAAQSRQLLDALAQTVLHPGRPDELRSQLRELEQTEFAPPPLLTGDDLTAAGLSPGPIFKRLLDETYDAQLENQISTREQALEMALRSAARAAE
ncbi:MAG TPA: CCA tRNA nucleotidyltransferase [Humisphaera sp.]|jgi:tRNA nucleotidyltransferase/poly(A) polymerase|nr:CCA tRNA nucleotidyltransferase [Humisphaera sp.]